MNDRAALPPILWPEDIAVVLRLPHERAAREWILKHGLKHVRIGKRVYVLRESLMEFLKEKETRRPSREEIRDGRRVT